MDRRDLGQWMLGPDRSSDPDRSYPGERLGRPETGSRSVAGTGRRLASLLIDWGLCLLIVRGFFGPEALEGDASLAVVGVLVLENLLLIGTAGATLGQRLVGLRVERLNGGAPGPVRALVRAVLLGLALPALTMLWEEDRRGLHDIASGTLVTVR